MTNHVKSAPKEPPVTECALGKQQFLQELRAGMLEIYNNII